MPKVSIIMPSLNVVNYIEQAITSVLKQTLSDIEIVCVDAGSDDGTLEIIRAYEKKDSRVKVVISDKKSYGYQMNLGIEKAIGEYIGIVETDDYILPEMYQDLYEIAITNKLDFVKSDYKKFWWNEDNSIYVNTGRTSDSYGVILTEQNRIKFYEYSSLNWTGIYKRDYLISNHITHSDTPGASYQDIGFWLQNMSFARRAMWVNKAYYMYRQDNPASSMKNRGKLLCSMNEYKRVLDILRSHGLEREYEECLLLKQMDYHVTFNRIDDSLKKEFIEVVRDEYRNDIVEISNIKLNEEQKRDVAWIERILISKDIEIESISEENEKTLSRIVNADELYLYGAGQVATKCFEKLYSAGVWDKVKMVMVSDEAHSKKFFEKDIIVFNSIDIKELFGEHKLFVLGLGRKGTEEILDKFKKLGLTNYILATEIEKLNYTI